MTQVQHISDRRFRVQSLAPAAYVAAAGFLLLTILGFTLGFADIPAVNWAFLVTLVATTLALAATSAAGVAPRRPAVLAIVGYGAIAVGVFIGILLGEDPDWFFLIGGPGNLLAAIGMVWIGIHVIVSQVWPRWTGVLFVLAGLFSVLFAELGTSLLAVVLWSVVGWRLTRENRAVSAAA